MSGLMILIILKNIHTYTHTHTHTQTKLYPWEATYKEKSAFLDRFLRKFPIHYFIFSQSCI